MADAFMAAIFGADKVKATARFKDVRTGKAKTVTLITVPTDITDEAFMEAAKAGVNLSVKGLSKDSDRSKNITGNGVYGAAATSATANVLGFTIPEPKATEASEEPVKARAKMSANTLNGASKG